MMKPISQLRDIICLACIESALGPKTCHLERAKETSWKRIAALLWGPHSISKAERWHHLEKTHFHHLHLWSYSFSHYSELVTTGESKDIDQSVNRQTHFYTSLLTTTNQYSTHTAAKTAPICLSLSQLLSLENKTQIYLNSSTWCSNLSPTQSGHSLPAVNRGLRPRGADSHESFLNVANKTISSARSWDKRPDILRQLAVSRNSPHKTSLWQIKALAETNTHWDRVWFNAGNANN